MIRKIALAFTFAAISSAAFAFEGDPPPDRTMKCLLRCIEVGMGNCGYICGG